ncbi:hypothetical protein ACFOWX_04160 [Sphingorhabdus arenilitoris]|uniref:5-bromo-4-chloroindolyl phosphate hydrolase n=1 Tax=Sphingorhabdus arenilitoris TaxID=1490041 RepID=A0ABV8RFD0_9SPHN
MNNIASQSDEIIRAASNSLRAQKTVPIGMKARALRKAHFWGKVRNAALAVGAVLIGAGIVGAVIDGIGFWGVMITGIAGAAAAFVLMRYPDMPMPTTESLKHSDLETLAGKTEIWLEAQQPLLPAPAVKIMQDIGVRLDQLAPQLSTLNENDPAAREVRKLVGEHLPELVNGYKRIPASLKQQDNKGKTPEEQLVSGLKLIDREIETVTGQIARGELDKLAIRDRYLELRYDGAGDQ